MTKFRGAACVFTVNDQDEVLSISRKTDETKIGLVGGKRDPEDRDDKHTAAREFEEETGAAVDEADLVHLYEGDDYNGFWAVTFFVPFDKIKGTPRTVEKGAIVRWVTFERLCHIEGPFADYNVRAVAAYKKMKAGDQEER